MKSPREILLARHRDAVPRLDQIRARSLTQLPRAALPQRNAGPAPFWRRAWTELFWSCRGAWLALATAWLVILSLDAWQVDPPARSSATAQPASSLTLLHEQQRWRAQLMNISWTSDPLEEPAPKPRRPPGPDRELLRDTHSLKTTPIA